MELSPLLKKPSFAASSCVPSTAPRATLGLRWLFRQHFFAYTHFKIPTGEWTKVGLVQWQTGWLDAYWMLVGIAVEFEFRRFLALWLLGMLLGALTLRARTLWPAVGLHGGLVFRMFCLMT